MYSRPRQKLRWAVAVIGLIALAGTAPPEVEADMRAPSILHPRTYRSPAGTFALTVDPSHRDGRAAAAYRLTRGDKPVWAENLPFTLWEAGVTDDGVGGGYAYSAGRDGWGDDGGHGDFRIVLLDPHGGVRLNEAVPRQFTGVLHAPPAPVGLGLFLDPANGRLVVRVHIAQEGEAWWAYRLSDGAALGRPTPRPGPVGRNAAAYIADAQPVAGTPLVVVHWWITEYTPPRNGARFALVDAAGETVWSLDRPGDYDAGGNADAADRLQDQVREAGAILRTDQPGRFDVWLAADGRRATFAVERAAAGGWAVREVGREPYAPPDPPKVVEPAIPVTRLKQLRSAVLGPGPAGPPSPIRHASGLQIDGRGRFAFIRNSGAERPALVVVDATGQLVAEVALTADGIREYDHWSQFAWVGGERFVVVQSGYEWGARAAAWWVDVGTKRVSPVPYFDCPKVKDLAGAGDGGFVVLATKDTRSGGGYTLETTAYRFDSRGRRSWVLPAYPSDEPGHLFSPMAVAVTSAGEVAVLEGIRNQVKLFDRTGKFLKAIDLEKALGRPPRYPTHLAADRDGGLVIGDWQAEVPIARLRADGTAAAQLAAAYPDGRRSPHMQSVEVAPDGRLWATDGYALLRLAADGTVDRVLGPAPDPAILTAVAGAAVDGRGRVYAVDARTQTVHAFDAAGRQVQTYRPGPTDFPDGMPMPAVTVAAAGDVYLSDRGGDKFLHFAPDGARLGWESRLFDSVSEEWHFHPAGDRRWVATYHDVRLVDGRGAVVRTIARRPDGRWLENPRVAAVADDGSVAVSTSTDWPASAMPAVCLYTKDGDPVRTVTLPPPVEEYDPVTYNGDRLAAWTKAGIVLFDATGRPLGKFAPPGAGRGDSRRLLFLVSGGRELLIFDGRRTVSWYQMP